MNHESQENSDGSAPVGDDATGLLEFEVSPEYSGVGLRRIWHMVWRVLLAVLLTTVLLVIGGRPDLALLFHRPVERQPIPITVVCNVPWAQIRVDGHGPAVPCTQHDADALAMARLSMDAGKHTVIATAEGFEPYSIYVVAHEDTAGLYLTQFALTPQGSAQLLDAVNSYFTSAYAQDVIFPATLWQSLGLRQPPSATSLLVRDRFEAVALDAYEPFYAETTYQRPIPPERGAVGVAVIVVDHVTIYDACGTTPLLERRVPVLYATRASVTLSARLNARRWSATNPYVLNPAADIYTAPDQAAAPATPASLVAMAARTDLAAGLGRQSLLAGAVTVTPLLSATNWAGGAVLTLTNAAQPGARAKEAQSDAVWLYLAGDLLALTPAAQALAPNARSAPFPTGLNALRASLASQPSRVCGGE